MNNPLPNHVQAIERVAALVMRAQAISEQSDITTGPVLHAQQIVAKLDRLIENVAKSSGLLRLVPTQAPIGPSAVIRPVPGGEYKGMLKLVDFTQPANGAVSRNADQSLTFRPKPGFTGRDSFDYTLCDDAGTIFSATVTVAVTLEATGHSEPTRSARLSRHRRAWLTKSQ